MGGFTGLLYGGLVCLRSFLCFRFLGGIGVICFRGTTSCWLMIVWIVMIGVFGGVSGFPDLWA